MSAPYSYPIASFIITPSMIGQAQLINTGNRLGGWLLVQNNSPYKIQVFLPGSANSLPLDPQTVDKLAVNTGDTQVYILPTLFLPGAAPSSQVDIQVFPYDEPPGTYPMALARQTSPVASTSKNAYFQDAVITGVAGQIAVFNVFNPPNSGLLYVFYSAVINPGSTANTVTNLILFRGADLNLTNQGTANPHDLNQPTSLAHCTAGNVAALSSTSIPKQRLNTPINIDTELLPFPDQITAHPGDNVTISSNLGNGLSGSAYLTWTEQ